MQSKAEARVLKIVGQHAFDSRAPLNTRSAWHGKNSIFCVETRQLGCIASLKGGNQFLVDG
jgi:hypothetical protein